MARVERPEIGTEMYAVFEHRYYIPGHAAPVMEYCVCKGAVRGFFAGGYTEVSLLFTGPDGSRSRITADWTTSERNCFTRRRRLPPWPRA